MLFAPLKLRSSSYLPVRFKVKTRSIAVVGAGLGGLTAALSLINKGFEVVVFEQSKELHEVGAGVQLSPNAMRVFAALGIEQKIIDIAFEPDAHVVRAWNTGALVSSTRMKGVYRKQYGGGYYGLHRADFQMALAGALPGGIVQLGKKCTGVASRSDGVTLRFEDGSSAEADIVVGADGIHSAARTSMFGPESPRFTGNVCWRGLVPSDMLPSGLISPDMNVYFGPHASFAHYYVRRGEYVNWIAMAEQSSWTRESWSLEVDHSEVMQFYAAWYPAIHELITRTERCYKWALLDRDPLPKWTSGRTTLLGDAAHPMLPYLAQGACMAIEDAYALATLLAKYSDDGERALREYEAERLPRTSRVQLTARARSRINHLPSPAARMIRNLNYGVQKLLKPNQHTYKIEWIYGYDVTSASAKAAS